MTCATYAADSDNAERYVLGQMGEAEQASFEEHYFGCDECFASVQTLQQMQTARHILFWGWARAKRGPSSCGRRMTA